MILGGIKLITKDKPDIIFEINKINFEQCLSLLSDLNYKLYFLDETIDASVEIKKIEDRFFTKPEGSNCYATIQK